MKEYFVRAYYEEEIKTGTVFAESRREAEQKAMELFDADCFLVSEVK